MMIRGRVQNGVVLVDDPSSLPEGALVRVELIEPGRSQSALAPIALLDSWLEDESGYDERSWPELKSDLDEHRLSARKLFNGETGSP
jgi:hypothetical protein